jgi:hypothetical protein
MLELPHTPGEIISYLEMCQAWSTSFQRGMNFRLRPSCSVILMSRRVNAPYTDQIDSTGLILTYEGHDAPKRPGEANPKTIDQPSVSSHGSPTQNGLFFKAAQKAKDGGDVETVAVYEKIHSGIWAFNGLFSLTDGWVESDGKRQVYKFRLALLEVQASLASARPAELGHTRLIPSSVKLDVWKRDRGCCVLCGADDNLHFDHDLPYSRGGSSITVANIRLLCARHNLSKRDKIE